MNETTVSNVAAGERIIKCNIIDDVYISFESEGNTNNEMMDLNERTFNLPIDWTIESLFLNDDGTKIGFNVDNGSEPIMTNFEEFISDSDISYVLDTSNRVYDNDGHWFVKLLN